MAWAPGARLGSLLSRAAAESQAAALREEMKTLVQPAWRRLGKMEKIEEKVSFSSVLVVV